MSKKDFEMHLCELQHEYDLVERKLEIAVYTLVEIKSLLGCRVYDSTNLIPAALEEFELKISSIK